MDNQFPVAGYYRVSKAREGRNSPQLYEEQIHRYCEYRGFTLARIYADIDHSGYNNSRARPALKELCDQRRTYAAVVVPKLSRFGRSMAHLFEMYTSFSEDGVDLIFLDVGVDSSTSQGKLLRNVMSAFAEYESDVRSDYAKTNAEHAARLGRPNGMAPLGYRYRGRGLGLEVVEDKARIVRHIFRLYTTKGEPILPSLASSTPTATDHRAESAGTQTLCERFSIILPMWASADTMSSFSRRAGSQSSPKPHGRKLSRSGPQPESGLIRKFVAHRDYSLV